MDLKRVVGHRIREFRTEAGLTREGLADEIGRSVEALGYLERGESAPRFETLERIVQTLNQPAASFFINLSSDRETLISKLNVQASQLQKQDLEIVIELAAAILKRRKKRGKK